MRISTADDAAVSPRRLWAAIWTISGSTEHRWHKSKVTGGPAGPVSATTNRDMASAPWPADAVLGHSHVVPLGCSPRGAELKRPRQMRTNG